MCERRAIVSSIMQNSHEVFISTPDNDIFLNDKLKFKVKHLINYFYFT